MDLDFSAEDLAFRDEVRTFIAENYPAELRGKLAEAAAEGDDDEELTDELVEVAADEPAGAPIDGEAGE